MGYDGQTAGVPWKDRYSAKSCGPVSNSSSWILTRKVRFQENARMFITRK